MPPKQYVRRKRNNKNFAVLNTSVALSLSTLSDDTVLDATLMSSALTEDFFLISADMSCSIRGLTAGQGDPMSFGICHGDYAAAEIRQNLDNEYLGPGTKIEQEQSRRLVRESGILQQQGNQDDTFTNLNAIGRDGSRIIRTSCKFFIESGRTVKTWIWNRSGGSLTTGATAEIRGKLYGRWHR